jgi:selenium donor protein
MEQIEFCKGGGCTAKLGPDILDRVLSRLPAQKRDPDLLVGFDTNDDAAVYRVSGDRAIVQTLDFFPPMVDDPYLFGQIAAANAMSDIWAMGGRPVTALNIVCFPQSWDLNILGRIMQGGAKKVAEAGASLCGGHSINDNDVKYGLSVTGLIDPARVLTNVGARAGDRLLLTKPLGTGIVCTAGRVKAADPASMDEVIRSMTTLNKYAAQVLSRYEVHACTDVTGFSLLGHLSEMLGMKRRASGSPDAADGGRQAAGGRQAGQTDQTSDMTLSDSTGQTAGTGLAGNSNQTDHAVQTGSGNQSGSSPLGAVIHTSAVPHFKRVREFVEEDFFITANGQRNRNHLGDLVEFQNTTFWQQELLFDPQTSGGLLAAVPNEIADEVLTEIKKLGLPCSLIGEVTDQLDHILVTA